MEDPTPPKKPGVIENRKDMDWTDEERARIEKSVQTAAEHSAWFVKDEESTEVEVVPPSTEDDKLHSLFFKNNSGCKYTLSATTIKVFIEGCKDCSFTFTGDIKTQMVELWRCENVTVNLDCTVKTFQADVSKKVDITYKNKEQFHQLVWGGVRELSLEFEEEKDAIATGVEPVKEKFPDMVEDVDQFIIRYIEGSLLEERVIRLKNGFPSTEREAAAFDEKAAKDAEAAEEYVRNLVKWAAPKIGIKDDRKRPKVGRNAICPVCPSGKKFKNCCWNKYAF